MMVIMMLIMQFWNLQTSLFLSLFPRSPQCDCLICIYAYSDMTFKKRLHAVETKERRNCREQGAISHHKAILAVSASRVRSRELPLRLPFPRTQQRTWHARGSPREKNWPPPRLLPRTCSWRIAANKVAFTILSPSRSLFIKYPSKPQEGGERMKRTAEGQECGEEFFSRNLYTRATIHVRRRSPSPSSLLILVIMRGPYIVSRWYYLGILWRELQLRCISDEWEMQKKDGVAWKATRRLRMRRMVVVGRGKMRNLWQLKWFANDHRFAIMIANRYLVSSLDYLLYIHGVGKITIYVRTCHTDRDFYATVTKADDCSTSRCRYLSARYRWEEPQ